MSNSLLMVVQNTPAIEPLPAYRRDPETSSIRSSAPSYVSEAPTYHSTIPTSASATRTGLPPASYVPGFHNLQRIDRAGLTHLNFSVSQWSSTYSSPQARHYHNVAARRTQLAMIEEQNMITALTNTMAFPNFTVYTPANNTSAASPAAQATVTDAQDLTRSSEHVTTISSSPRTNVEESTASTLPAIGGMNEPLSPLEDPDLVGHAAASAARERRLYIAAETRTRRQQEERDAQAIREESRRWDFLLSQMADWEERERGWKAFSKKMEAKTTKSSAKRVLFRFWK